jgi:SAM-dependent methyltransferase
MSQPIPRASADYTGPTRFKAHPDQTFDGFKAAAEAYASNQSAEQRRGFIEKPLDWSPGHPTYFLAMHQLLNALKAMDLQPADHILEVGSGAGWATEIMASLGYHIHCVEPSADLAEIAKTRVASILRHFDIERWAYRTSWRIAAIEEAELEIESADAALYFESLHHVVDEHAALRSTWRALRPGGRLVIVGDANWMPGNLAQEAALREEMAAFGTLESPYTHAYLEHLLGDCGFVDVRRHHSVNGLVPVERENQRVRDFAELDADHVNLITARKPGAAVAGAEPPSAIEVPGELEPPPAARRRSVLGRLASRLFRAGA